MQVVFHRVDLRLHVLAGKLHRDKRMRFARIPGGLKIGVVVAVKSDGMRLVMRLNAAIVDSAGAAQIEAKLDAVAVEAAAPIDGRNGLELMVFHADALARKGTVELSPAFLHLRPSAAFVCRSHKTFIISVWQMRGKSTQGRTDVEFKSSSKMRDP